MSTIEGHMRWQGRQGREEGSRDWCEQLKTMESTTWRGGAWLWSGNELTGLVLPVEECV